MKISLDIYRVKLNFETNSEVIFNKIKKDFSFFIASKIFERCDVHIKSFLRDQIPWHLIPEIPSKRQSKSSITYNDSENASLRYNDYYGKLLSIYDYQKDQGQLFSSDIDKLHEISYLLILSRSGKRMDLMGLHKLHAFGIVYRGQAILGMMPSKGGKTTHLIQFLKDPQSEFLSDDTPVISRSGKIKPFPLRLGIEGNSENGNEVERQLKVENREENIYTIKREFFGLKTLISFDGLSSLSIAKEYDQVILFLGRRSHARTCHIVPASKISMLFSLFKYMIIGVGLPIVFEYFWQDSIKDFFIKAKIFLSRCVSAIFLSLKSKTYIVYLGQDIQENTTALKQLASRLK